MTKRIRKYEEGPSFANVFEAMHHLMDGAYFWQHGRPVHPAWINSWPIAMFRACVESGSLCRARQTKEYQERNAT